MTLYLVQFSIRYKDEYGRTQFRYNTSTNSSSFMRIVGGNDETDVRRKVFREYCGWNHTAELFNVEISRVLA